MYDARETTARALLLALVLIGCDEGGGSDDGSQHERDAASLAAGDTAVGLDSGSGTWPPTSDGATSAVDPGSPRPEGSRAFADGGSSDGGSDPRDARAEGAPDASWRADAAAQSGPGAPEVPDAAFVDAYVALDGQAGDATPHVDADADVDDAAGPVCVDQGERCDRASCCTGVCVRDDEGGAICAAECALPTRCEGCGPYCGASRMGATRCDDAVLIAEDGTYLGDAAGSALDRDSVCNANGSYGSSFGRLSIFNANGQYGNGWGRHSPYNMNSLSPPAIACRGSDDIIAYVSKNRAQARTVVDPDELCAWLRQRGM